MVFSMAIITVTLIEKIKETISTNRFTKFECYEIPCIVQIRESCLISVRPTIHRVERMGPYNKKNILTTLRATHSIESSESPKVRDIVSSVQINAEKIAKHSNTILISACGL